MEDKQNRKKQIITVISLIILLLVTMSIIVNKNQSNIEKTAKLPDVKLDSTIGEVEAKWAKVLGYNDSTQITCIEKTRDGGFIVGGYSDKSITLENGSILSNNGGENGIIIKYDSNMKVQWGKTLLLNTTRVTSIIETMDGDYLIGGYFAGGRMNLGNNVIISAIGASSSNDGMIIKLDNKGNAKWGKVIGMNARDEVNSVIEDSDGGYIVVGNFTNSNINLGNGVILNNINFGDAFIIKYDKNGNAQWAKTIGKMGSEYLNKIIKTSDGGYIVGGYFNNVGNYNIDVGNGISITSGTAETGMIIKYDSNWNAKWVKKIDGNYSEQINNITNTSDGGFLVTGTFTSNSINLGNGVILTKSINNSSYTDGMIIKYDRNGNVQWGKVIGGTQDSSEVKSAIEVSDGGYIVVGIFRPSSINLGNNIILNNARAGGADGMIIKYDRDGNAQWAKAVGSTLNADMINCIVGTEDEGFLVGGQFGLSINLGNGVIINSGNGGGMIIKYGDDRDRIPPTITIKSEKGEYAKTKQIIIEIEDEGGSELSDNNSYQYYLSSSSTELIEGEWINYISGGEITIGEGRTGVYYIFIKRIEDNEGNISIEGGTVQEIEGISYQRFGPYKFDNTSPTIEFETNGDITYKKAQKTVVKVIDEGGAEVNNSTLKYLWTQTIEEPTEELFETEGKTFENEGTITKEEVTGNNWYLWVQAEDNVGNKVIARTNEFYLDNTLPTITNTELINNIIKIEANDIDEIEGEGSGVSKYRYITSNTKLINPIITPDNSTEVEAIGEIVISNIDKIKYIYILAEDKAENSSDAIEIKIPEITIETETNLEVEEGQGGIDIKVNLEWEGEKIYKIYQKSEEEDEWTEIATTSDKEITIRTTKDIKKPNAPEIEVKGINEENKISINQTAIDNGSIYKFYIEVYDKTNTEMKLLTSEEITKEVITGVKGYYYKVEEIADNEDNGTYIEGNTLELDLTSNGKRLKIKTVDRAGNIGEESSILIYITTKATINPNGGMLEESEETKEVEGLVGQTIDLGIPTREGYTFKGWKTTSGKIEGTQFTYGKEEEEIIAEWQKNKYKYTINYLEKDTNIVLQEPKEVFDAEYEETIISSKEVIKIPGYYYDNCDKESITIQIDEAKNVVNIYYTIRTDIKYKIEYYYDEIKDEEKTIEGQATYKETINSYEDKIIEGYILVKEEKKPLTIEENENKNIMKIYYAKEMAAKVQYINKNTDEIIEEITEDGYIGKELKTEAKNFENYVLVEEPEEKTVKMEENMIIKYYYVHISKGVIEKHIDIETDEIIYNTTYEGNEGDEYTTEAKEFRGYDLVEEKRPENSTGKMGLEAITVNYYYKKKIPIKITIKYIDKNTNEEIEEETIIAGYEGEIYTIEQKNIEGYEFIEVVGETNGTITEDKEVIYYYKMVNEPEIPGEGGTGEEEDPTIINKDIPNAGWTKEIIALSTVAVMSEITLVLTWITIKRMKMYKRYKE